MGYRAVDSGDGFEAETDPGLFIKATNFLMFLGAWLAGVTSVSSNRPMVGVVVAVVVVAWHLNVSRRPLAELKTILLAGLVGTIWEVLLVGMDWVQYPAEENLAWPPLWSCSLWVAFGSTLSVSLHGLKTHPFLSVVVGAVLGPVSWWSAERMGALTLVQGNYSLLVAGAGWALLVPLLLTISEHVSRQVFELPETEWSDISAG